MFISTLVVGTVSLTSPFKSIERPLIRDLIVLLATAYWISCIIHNEQIRLVESIGFIVLYVVYIIVVVGSQIIKHFINKFYRQRSLDSNYSDVIFIDDIIDDTEDDIYPKFHRRIFSDSNSDFDVDVDSEALILPDEDRHPESLTSSFRRIFVVYSWRQFRSFGLIRKFYVIVNYPISLILRLSCPQLYYSMPNHNWNRLLNTFHCISSPLTIQLITATFQYKVSTYGIPLCYITVPISIVIAIIVWFSSMYNEPPIYFKLYAFIAFFVSIIWVYFIAGEIVNVLTALGIVMNLSNTLMGLSFLAFGNSIADLTADVILAKRGMQNAAVSACFAGPIFNLLIGVGCPFTIYTALNGTLILQTSLLQKVIPYCLIISIAYSLVILTCSRFQFSRVYGTSLCIGFIVYISICAFIETR
ncbi:hypothetical protein GJ496_001111 [Pomphorhynchus laevis]|nr:hypothetical protein GJ496_001111 [Pomphorhynchus laevis]